MCFTTHTPRTMVSQLVLPATVISPATYLSTSPNKRPCSWNRSETSIERRVGQLIENPVRMTVLGATPRAHCSLERRSVSFPSGWPSIVSEAMLRSFTGEPNHCSLVTSYSDTTFNSQAPDSSCKKLVSRIEVALLLILPVLFSVSPVHSCCACLLHLHLHAQ